jgi:putative intracellular protease/amidase
MRILMVLTSHDQLGETERKTGFWLEEFAAPYYVFKDAGADVTIASPKGGQPPIDPSSDVKATQTEDTRRFADDTVAQRQLATTHKLSDVNAADFDAIFYPGGHGPLWDLAEDPDSKGMIEFFANANRPIGAVCHAPAVFQHTMGLDAKPLVADRRVTGFTNSEEEGAKLVDVVPFLVEDMLISKGAHYEKGPDWASFVVTDGKLVTGQNPASSKAAAEQILKLLRNGAHA